MNTDFEKEAADFFLSLSGTASCAIQPAEKEGIYMSPTHSAEGTHSISWKQGQRHIIDGNHVVNPHFAVIASQPVGEGTSGGLQSEGDSSDVVSCSFNLPPPPQLQGFEAEPDALAAHPLALAENPEALAAEPEALAAHPWPLAAEPEELAVQSHWQEWSVTSPDTALVIPAALPPSNTDNSNLLPVQNAERDISALRTEFESTIRVHWPLPIPPLCVLWTDPKHKHTCCGYRDH